MVGKEHRLNQSRDIRHVLRYGQKHPHTYATLYILPNQKNICRVACVVSKKVSASAVERHQIQRWLREIGRKMVVTQTPSADIVMLATPAASQVKELQELEKDILGVI